MRPFTSPSLLLLLVSAACVREDGDWFPVVDDNTERSCDALLPTSSVVEALELDSVVTLPIDAQSIRGNVCDRYFYRSPDDINRFEYQIRTDVADTVLGVSVWEAESPDAAPRVLEQLVAGLAPEASQSVEVREETHALAGVDGQLVVTTERRPGSTWEPRDAHVVASFIVGPYAAEITAPYYGELKPQAKIDAVERLATELAAALARPDPPLPDPEVRPDLTTVITGDELAAACSLEPELPTADRDAVSVGVEEAFGKHSLSVRVHDYATPALARYDLVTSLTGTPMSGEVEGWLGLAAETHDGAVHVGIAGVLPVGPWVVEVSEVRHGATAPSLSCSPADISALVTRVADALR